jgi:hypothetical protein
MQPTVLNTARIGEICLTALLNNKLELLFTAAWITHIPFQNLLQVMELYRIHGEFNWHHIWGHHKYGTSVIKQVLYQQSLLLLILYDTSKPTISTRYFIGTVLVLRTTLLWVIMQQVVVISCCNQVRLQNQSHARMKSILAEFHKLHFHSSFYVLN